MLRLYDWPFTGENSEIQDMCESEAVSVEAREMSFQLETTIGWLALGLARIYTDTAL